MITTNEMNYFSPQILFCVLFMSFGFLPSAFAGERIVLPEKQVSYVHYGTNLVLEKVIEDMVIISGKKYIYTDQTFLIDHDRQNQGLTFREIASPCLVNLVYKQYSLKTELVPFVPGTRILEKLTIIERIDPAVLDKYMTEDSQNVN